jgi:transposase
VDGVWVKMNYVFGKQRDQVLIESIEEYVHDNSEVRVMDKLVDSFDLDSLGFLTGKNDETGRPKYNPQDMLKLYIYGYYNGILSSRKLQKQAMINREVIWLLKGLQPKQRAISDFRKENTDALKQVFEVFVDFCNEIGLYGKSLIAIDGTKIEASASKRRHISKRKLTVMKEKVQAQINEYMQDLEINDRLIENTENKRLNKAEIEKTIASLKERLNKYDNQYKDLETKGINEINRTDPDARTVKFGANQGTDLGYNIQTAVDDKHNLIAAFDVINSSADQGQLYNMATKAKDKLGVEKIEVLADKGYYNLEDIIKCEANGITTYVSKPKNSNSIGDSRYFIDKFKYIKELDIYICPEGNCLECMTIKSDTITKRYRNLEACANCQNKEKCTTAKAAKIVLRGPNEPMAEHLRERLKNGMSKYKKRQNIVEHPFGTIKRTMNFYYLLTRKFRMVRGEVSVAIFAYNLKRVISIMGFKGLMERIIRKMQLKVA